MVVVHVPSPGEPLSEEVDEVLTVQAGRIEGARFLRVERPPQSWANGELPWLSAVEGPSGTVGRRRLSNQIGGGTVTITLFLD